MSADNPCAQPWRQVPDRARALFGDRLTLAVRYVELLCTVAVDRGLFGPREPARVWERHVLPGAALGELVAPGARVADVGSGAGLPGIPLAIARPDLALICVEPMLRRVQFLQEAIGLLGLNASVIRARGEESGGTTADVVVARAVAPLARLLPVVAPVLSNGGLLLAVKGQAAVQEVSDAHDILARMAAHAEVKQVGGGADLTTVVTVAVPANSVRSQARGSGSPRAESRGAT